MVEPAPRFSLNLAVTLTLDPIPYEPSGVVEVKEVRVGAVVSTF